MSDRYIDGVPWRVVLHTIEASQLPASWKYPPHDGLDATRRIHTAVLDHSIPARALEHNAGYPETNRARCIQWEIKGFARDAQSQPDDEIDWLARELHPVLVEYGIPIATTPHAWGNAGHTDRMSNDEWLAFSGICGHCHVPGQLAGHWDPGMFRIDRLLATLHQLAGDTPSPVPTPAPVFDEGEPMDLIHPKRSDAEVAVTNWQTKRKLGPQQVNTFVAVSLLNGRDKPVPRPVEDAVFDSIPDCK